MGLFVLSSVQTVHIFLSSLIDCFEFSPGLVLSCYNLILLDMAQLFCRDQFSLEKEGTCPWCKETDSIEEIDKEDLENLGIRLPN